MGADCGIDNLDDIGKMVDLCNAYGLDTIEAGVTIGVAMDSGLLPFGDAEGAINLLEEMGKGTPLGRLLGMGAAGVAKPSAIHGARRSRVRPCPPTNRGPSRASA